MRFWDQQFGVLHINRFEMIHLCSVMRAKDGDRSCLDFKQDILNGLCPFYIRRVYTDGSKRCFSIGKGGILHHVDDVDAE